jgi:hypothetical protein
VTPFTLWGTPLQFSFKKTEVVWDPNILHSSYLTAYVLRDPIIHPVQQYMWVLAPKKFLGHSSPSVVLLKMKKS